MKKIIPNILKIVSCITAITFIPFIFPLITRFFIHIHLYENIEVFKEYISIFLNKNFLAFIGIILVSTIIITSDKNKIMEWISQWNIFAKYKDAELNLKKPEIIDESDKKKKFISNFNNDEIDKSITSEMQEELKLIKNSKNKDKKKNYNDEKIEELEKENNNLRFYSAYNIINKKTKELLNVIYCDKSMKLQEFKEALIYSLKNRNRRNKNLTNAQKNEYANNKYETIKNGLQYLNIIEISDDNKIITLTQYGKEFVKKYIEKEVGENED